MRLGRRFVATEDVLGQETVPHADRVQSHPGQFLGIASEHSKPAAALAQSMQQLASAFCRARRAGQLALVLQQPGVLGGGLLGR